MPAIEKPALRRTASILFVLIFHFLFLDQSLGINLIITEILLLAGYLLLSGKRMTVFRIPLWILWAVSLYGILFVNSALSLTTNVIVFLLLLSSEWSVSANLTENVLNVFWRMYPSQNKEGTRKGRGTVFWISYLFFPALLLIVFFFLYAHSVPSFFNFFETIASYLPDLSIASILLLILGALLAAYCWKLVTQNDYAALGQEELKRNKRVAHFKGLNPGYRRLATQAVITLSGLILMGTLALILDMRYFWFSDHGAMDYNHAQWALRKGTGGLIVAILASIAVALYFFRGNMAFFSKSAVLKKLTYVWLCLNVLLCISLLVRTVLYVEQFNLAYKRIGVITFIACAIFGIVSILYQMARSKNAWFLVRVNLYSFLITFLLLGSFNWDKLIVTYNLNHPEAYQDLDFLFTRDLGVLLNATLDPALLEKEIEGSKNHEYLLRIYGPITYKELINRRIMHWKQRTKYEDWRSWNGKKRRVTEGLYKWSQP